MTVIVINIHYRGPSNRFLPHRLRRFLLIHVMSVDESDQQRHFQHQIQQQQRQQRQQHQQSASVYHSPADTSAFVPPAYSGNDSTLKTQFKPPEEQSTPSASLLTEIEMKIASSFNPNATNQTQFGPNRSNTCCESTSSGHKSPHQQVIC